MLVSQDDCWKEISCMRSFLERRLSTDMSSSCKVESMSCFFLEFMESISVG